MFKFLLDSHFVEVDRVSRIQQSQSENNFVILLYNLILVQEFTWKIREKLVCPASCHFNYSILLHAFDYLDDEGRESVII